LERKRTLIWSFFDFATTPVAFAVNAMYLPLMIIAAGGTNTTVGILPLVTGGVAALWTPLVGVFIDRAESRTKVRRTMVFLSTLFAALSILMIAFVSELGLLLIAFSTMSISIQTGWTAINSFLASESEDQKLGYVSGFGITMGYIGGALGAGGAVLLEAYFSRSLALVYVGGFLLVFGILPAVFLEDRVNSVRSKMNVTQSLSESFAVIKSNSSIRAYLVGSILWGDGISTIVTFASLIAVQVLLIPLENATMFLAMALPAAIIGAFAQGKIGDHVGLVKSQAANLSLWIVGILIIILGGGMLPIILVASVAGFALGGNVALSRALYARIIPDGMEGRLFGISAIFVFFGGAIGPLLTGLVADISGLSLRYALIVPLIFILISLPTLRYIKEQSGPFQ
jgi:UMF1 family MFS transporter